MPGFLVLTDLSFVTRAFNLRYVVGITLVHNGQGVLRPGQDPFHPLVDVATSDGAVYYELQIPTVDRGTPDTAGQAIRNFFAQLEGRPTA
jgi:hypothetical protein